MDVLRSCYKTSMKLWKDRDTLTPVRWFFCEPGAKVFERLCSFRSLKTWDRVSDRTGMVGEKNGVTPYDKGANPLIYEGVNHCGTDLAMAEGGLSSRDPEIVTDSNGWATCCSGDGPLNLPKEVCILWPEGNLEAAIPTTGIMTMPSIPWVAQFHLIAYTPWDSGETAPWYVGVPFNFPCWWIFSTLPTAWAEDANWIYQIRIGIGLRGRGVARPPNCELDTCGPPLIYIERGATSKATGIYAASQIEYSGLIALTAFQQSPFQAAFVTTQPEPAIFPPLTVITMSGNV